DELGRAWPRYGDALADTLDATARSSGPTPSELTRIGQAGIPVGLVTFVDDPLHPVSVAQQWHARLPRSVLRRLALADCSVTRAVLGDVTMAAWRAARNMP
ncbi:MAG TPA: alpha/beta hydrolase, partial [Mycobacteriales bacterium]